MLRIAGRHRGLVLLAALAAALAAVVAAVALSGRRGADRPAIKGTAVTAKIVGFVSRVDDQGTLLVARGILDFRAPAIRIGPHTKIAVGGKEGGIGDVREGAYVAVTYESRDDGLVAEWIGVYETLNALHADAADRALAPKDPPSHGEPSAAPANRIPSPVVSTRSESTETVQPPPATARQNSRTPERIESAVPPPSPPAVPPRVVTRSPAAGEGEGPDPGAVIDWLLNKPTRP